MDSDLATIDNGSPGGKPEGVVDNEAMGVEPPVGDLEPVRRPSGARLWRWGVIVVLTILGVTGTWLLSTGTWKGWMMGKAAPNPPIDDRFRLLDFAGGLC